MELLFVVVIAVGIGALLRYLLPRRWTYGILLLPAVAGAITAVVWVALLWIGWSFDGTWIWVVSLAAGLLAALATAVLLPLRRLQDDDRKLRELGGGPA